jgi:CRISPR-associated protein Csb1
MTSQPNQFDPLIETDDSVAIILKQYLRPVEGDGAPIFPPTYPMPTYRGRVHTVRDGEYRVSVELPPYQHDGKPPDRAESADVAGYNIDEFSDGSNVCEIDSPQSQANRLEPQFAIVKDGRLVPQISIHVGRDRRPVNLLEAGHRAADAIVRFSSLVNDFQEAFVQARRGNHLNLARLAPTSILFGVWDSRGTQVKLPRIIKAEIRATNVEKLTRSAQFNPAIDYVAWEAVDEALDKGEGEKNPLGAEGMKHVPAPRTVGGVRVRGEIRRVVRVNLVAIRELCALSEEGTLDSERTHQLRKYVLGLALVAASRRFPLNLREGCLLCYDEKKPPTSSLILASGQSSEFDIDPTTAEDYAERAAREFFGPAYDRKDRPDARFESGVANEYLAMTSEQRKKVARSGPITAEAIRRVKEKGRDPLKLVTEALKEATKTGKEAIREAKKTDPRYRGRNAIAVHLPELLKPVTERLEELAGDEDIDAPVKEFAGQLLQAIEGHTDTAATFKEIGERIKAFNRQRTEGEAGGADKGSTEGERA